jgi:hypothetical protein
VSKVSGKGEGEGAGMRGPLLLLKPL